jgi:hypothetical protein
MPTDLPAVGAQKRKVQTQAQTDITIVSVLFIIFLVNLVLLLADQNFAKALEFMGQF